MFAIYFPINFDFVFITLMMDLWNKGPKRLDLSHIMVTSK